ncbi:PHP domain-containing protein [Arsenicicoccus piscis]|uniref:Histidinol-phosphatase n=1 Tax=Arsenicicoccus piscis TaxID=673954 RepID=A0ABQ6HT23_9MICO|nr:PHP domain-containing protein [Arsenicicoccus piscis]MCH8626257.1 PHP domain-containing protein [Arsenicicoccus piscis]GMA20849.1 histidinol-phosphatase [Arsenicicoccus piscis]
MSHPHEHGHTHPHSHEHDDHAHSHGAHEHPHSHDHTHGDEPLRPALDLGVPDSELPPAELGRRNFLRAAGVLGAGVAATSFVGAGGLATAAATEASDAGSRRGHRAKSWLAGDHHIHTQFSSDGLYRVADHVQHANAYGLDWMVITDHGSAQHVKIGVEQVNPEIVAARGDFPDMLVFQGLEWNIPAAEHGTVFVHPGSGEVSVLKAFEAGYDGVVKSATASNAANEQLALQGLTFLQSAVGSRQVKDALMLANHPARKGIDSPHEIRAWRDAAPGIAIGMEGAPGHQAAGLPTPLGPGSGRGYYDNAPSSDSFAAYPPESYRTFGGFDWMTATVGGLWDSLLSEGKPWWITANSDSHSIYLDTAVRGPGDDFAANGKHADPINGPVPVTSNGDYWPGYYSRTHVGVGRRSYAAVMEGLRQGSVWVDHGRLVDELDVTVRSGGDGASLGGALVVRRGSRARVSIRIKPAHLPNWAQFIPQLKKVDAIVGSVTGPAADKDTFAAPQTRVVKSWDVTGAVGRDGWIELSLDLGPIGDQGVYVRLRGSDGKRLAAGVKGASVDPAGPAIDEIGKANPWDDLWFYTNPIWVLPRR